MTQVVSYAQGSVSLLSNGSPTYTTLFTNSASYKTKVILTGLYLTCDSPSAINLYLTTFQIDGVTGQAGVLGWTARNETGGAWSFVPNADQTGVGGPVAAGMPAGVAVLASSQTTCNVSPTSLSPVASYSSSVTYHPGVFYLGPSDTFAMKLYWTSGGTFVNAQMRYSLILIQET